MTSKTPLVDVITCLDSYNNSHSKGSSSLKSTIWNISIARRQKGGLGVGYNYSAADVREELRAHAILECSEEPVLGDEDTKPEKDSINHEEVGSFVLHFGGMPSKKAEHENNTVLESSDGYGLRQRKGKESKTIEKEWTEITFKDEQEEKLRKVDPLELFGALPPKELKIAQKKAKETLENYVTAANKAREILRLMECHKSN